MIRPVRTRLTRTISATTSTRIFSVMNKTMAANSMARTTAMSVVTALPLPSLSLIVYSDLPALSNASDQNRLAWLRPIGLFQRCHLSH